MPLRQFSRRVQRLIRHGNAKQRQTTFEGERLRSECQRSVCWIRKKINNRQLVALSSRWWNPRHNRKGRNFEWNVWRRTFAWSSGEAAYSRNCQLREFSGQSSKSPYSVTNNSSQTHPIPLFYRWFRQVLRLQRAKVEESEKSSRKISATTGKRKVEYSWVSKKIKNE